MSRKSPSAGFASRHTRSSVQSAAGSDSYSTWKNAGSTTAPSRTLRAYSHSSQQMLALSKPAVVIATISGSFRAPIDVRSTSHNSRFGAAWSSS